MKHITLSLGIIGSLLLVNHFNINAQTVSGGTGHAIGICNDGTLSAWGLNDQNEIGQGSLSSNSCTCEASPIAVPGITGAIQVGAGGSHTLVLMSDSTVKAFGRNFDGELGNGQQVTTGCYCDLNIVDVAGLTDVIAVSSGYISSMALKADGTVWGWGGDAFGQLGDGTANATGCFCELTPVQAIGLTGITAITNGNFHALALKNDGTVWAWGNNMSGQLGIGNSTNTSTPTQVGITNVIAIAAGQNHSYALKNDGTVWAWGDNSSGQLGTGVATNVPLQVTGLTNIVAIANGFNHSIALKNDGTVWTWGANYSGQLGNGNTIQSNTAAIVPGLTDIVALGGTMGNFCIAIKSDGSVWSWGDNFWGSVGNGSATNALTPVLVQTCTILTETKSNENRNNLILAPNPVNQQLMIQLETKENEYLVSILDISGAMLGSYYNVQSIDMTDFASGVYVAKVTTPTATFVQRFIKY